MAWDDSARGAGRAGVVVAGPMWAPGATTTAANRTLVAVVVDPATGAVAATRTILALCPACPGQARR